MTVDDRQPTDLVDLVLLEHGQQLHAGAPAQKMTELGVGALPICGTDNKLKGMLTDRVIVVKVLGAGKDPGSCTAGDLAQWEAVTTGGGDR